MIIGQLLFTLILGTVTWIVGRFFFPIVEWGNIEGSVNGQNTPFKVKIDKNAPFSMAVLAQELFESEYRYDRFIIRLYTDGIERALEIRGHEVETQAAVLFYGESEEDYRIEEAKDMIKGYNGIFKKYLPEELAVKMKKHRSMAKKWVRKNKKRIEKLSKNQ